jgi:hypothetical protein
MDIEDLAAAGVRWGMYTFHSFDPQPLKAPGFNP